MPKQKQTQLGTLVTREVAGTLTIREPNALDAMASRLSTDRKSLWNVLKNTAFKGASDDQMITLVIVANQYRLNPLTREIYAFPDKKGGIVPVVSIDGWIRIVNEHPQCDGWEFEEVYDDKGAIVTTICTMYRKDRSRPCRIPEHYRECKRDTDFWRNMPCRALRHRSFVQSARYGFGFAGIYTEDEARAMVEAGAVTVQPLPVPEIPPVTADFPTSEPPAPETTRPAAVLDLEEQPPEDELPMEEAPPEPLTPPVSTPAPARPPTPAPASPPVAGHGLTPKGRPAYATVVSLCQKDQVNTTEVVAWAKEVGQAPEDARFLSSLTEQQLQTIIKNWNEATEQIRSMRK